MQLVLGEEKQMMEQRRLGAAFLIALALHVGAMGALFYWQSRDSESPPGEQEIAVDLAPAMEFAEAVPITEASAPAEVLAEPAPPTDVAETAQEVAEAPPQENAEPVEAVETAEAVPADPAPVAADAVFDLHAADPIAPPEETVVAKELEKPAPKPVKPPLPKKVDRPVRTTKKPIAEQRSAASAPLQGQAASSQENTGGVAASADPNVLNRYKAQLGATLRNRLRYPEAARAQGILGVATVRFTMLRSGQVLSSTLVRSAGNATLDQAALATVAPGSTLPAAPDALPEQQLTFSVPLRFNLR